MSPASPSTNGGVHRRRPSLLVTTPSSMDVPGLAGTSSQPALSVSTSLHSNSPGSIVLASPQAYTPTSASGQLASAGGARRRRASTTERSGEGAPSGVTAATSTSPNSSLLTGRAKRGARRSSGHSEHLPSPVPYLASLSGAPVPASAETTDPSSSSSTLGSPVNLLGLQHQQSLKPYFPSPPPSLSRPPPVSASAAYGGGQPSVLRTLPASSARPFLRTISSSASTAVYGPTSPSQSTAHADDLVPLSPGSGYLPSHAGRSSVASGATTAYDSEGSTSSNLPPYSLTPVGSSSARLPLLPLSGGPSGFNTAYQTAQTSPSLALSLQMESEPTYPGQSHFFDSTPSSPRPSMSTSGEADEQQDRARATALHTAAYPTASSSAFEKLLPTKDEMRETASEWRRWWKRRNSRSHGSSSRSGGSVGGIGMLSTSAGDRKKRRKRAGTGVGGSVRLGGPSWWRRIKPKRKKGWLLTGVIALLCLWSFVDWMFWVFNPDKVRIEYRPQCVSPHPNYHALSTLSPDTLQRISLPTIGQPLHPLLPNPLLAPSSLESDELEPAGVFVGVFSTDSAFERRMLIRSTWASGDVWRGRQGQGLTSTRVRFILGKPKSGWEELVRIEMETYGDIVILEVPENMNSGKTHDYFSWASDNALVPVGAGAVGERKPDYVVKSDDDSFIMLGELEKRLRVLRGRKVYWGYLIKNLFMGGECYALSLDLVHYVATSAPIRQLVRGAEDKLVARWMRMHPEKETILWASESCWVYDHPRAGTVYSHGFLYPSTAREIQQELLTLGSGSADDRERPAKAVNGTVSNANAPTDKRRKRADSLSYTSVSQFRKKYRPPLPNLTPLQRVEALVEGSEMSLLSPYSSVPDTSPLLPETVMARRPSIDDRYLGQWKAGRWGGGTVVVHYVKEREWFLETALAFERLGGGMGDEDYPVREGRKVETVREVQHVAGVDAAAENKESRLKRAAAAVVVATSEGEDEDLPIAVAAGKDDTSPA